MIALRSEAIKLERVLWAEKVYLVPRDDGRIMAGATVEHVGFDREVTAGAVSKLLHAAIELIPAFENARIEETWAGLRPDSPDHLPVLGGCRQIWMACLSLRDIFAVEYCLHPYG